jgi:branched-chain amino acid transport system ATP-binding protein
VLRLTNVQVRYGGAVLAIDDLSLDVPEGHLVTLLGANGAGKSTTLKAISGLLASEHGQVSRGGIEFDGHDITSLDPADRVRLGVVHVIEGRRVFQHLTVEENLRAGGHVRRHGHRPDVAYALFPRLRRRRSIQAGYLSGGEQQMLAIGRALMARPRLILLDEPSLGLAPLIVQDVFDVIHHILQAGTTILLVEQNAPLALSVASYAYVLDSGRIVLEGSPAALRDNVDVQRAYLGRRLAA